MSTQKGNSMEDWISLNPESYVDYLERLFAVTNNPLFIWEAMRVSWWFEIEPMTPSKMYLGSIADQVFSATRERRGFDAALLLAKNHKKHLNQFEELKDQRKGEKAALYFPHRLLELAEEAKRQGKTTNKAIIAHIAQRVGRSESLVKKLYAAAQRGEYTNLVVNDSDFSASDSEYDLFKSTTPP